jgi:hypothetical protein
LEGRTGKVEGCLSYKTDAAVSPSPLFSSQTMSNTSLYRIFATSFTNDARFVLSGSDDGNVRIWKARADEKLGIIDNREKAAMEYRDTLKHKWKMDAEIGRIARSVSLIHLLFLLPCLLMIRLLRQETTPSQTGLQYWQVASYYYRSCARQGGEEEKAHQSGRLETQRREEEDRHRGAVIGTLDGSSYAFHSLRWTPFALAILDPCM